MARRLESRKPAIEAFEERYLLSASAPNAADAVLYADPVVDNAAPATVRNTSYSGQTTYTDFPGETGMEPIAPHIVARSVFYNNSPLDGNDPNPNAADDGAIATDKSALLPGATASTSNYTTSSQGINGIMIDVASLRGVPSLADFVFKIGNTADPSQWSVAPQPSNITARAGAGVDGSTRVTITWADGAIENEWLQVTTRATVDTGLGADDVFYFGNSIAGSSTPLVTLSAPALAAAAAEPQQPELFDPGDGGYYLFFSPNLAMTKNGSVLAVAEARTTSGQDQSAYAIVMRRSLDDGATWSSVSTIYAIAPGGPDYIGNPSVVVDSITGDIFVLFCQDNNLVYVVKSSDDGLTWSTPTDITSSVKVTAAGNPNPAEYPSTPWVWYATGPGHGIQLQQGVHAGRLIIAADHQVSGAPNVPYTNTIYSDDHGLTWHLGGGLDQTQAVNMNSDEASIVERNDGSLYMSIRVDGGSIYHGHSISYDGGATWSNLVLDTALTTGSVEGSIVHIDADTYVFSAPDSTTGDRQALTIWVSYDDMQTWVQTKTIDYGDAAYSDMVQVSPDTVLVMYDGGRNGTNDQYIALAAFNLDWLESSAPDQFTWNFNEQAPGTLASLTGPSIMDSSPWDNRALALAPTAAQAPLYVSGMHPGDSALEITPSSSVQLTPSTTFALQFNSADSFTVELTMRTTDSNGVIIGKGPAIQDWNLQIVNGFLDFTVTDRINVAMIQSAAPINDGQWHRIAVVHDGTTRKLEMYIDGVEVAAPVDCSNVGSMIASNPVMLGAFGDGSGHLDFDIDTLRVTRAALSPGQFLSADYTAPPRVPLTTPPANAPTSLAGLQLWLPAYDATRDFSGDGIGDPLPIVPVTGTAAHWILDASPNQYSAYVALPNRELLYANDPSVGANWNFPAPQGAGERLLVPNSNGSGPNNFDFVQDTGVFTLSTFVNFGSSFGGYMTLFDTADTSTINTGFTLKVTSDGQLSMSIAGVNGTNSVVRFNDSTPTGTIARNTWYQIAVVGTGPGNPITFYVTPVTSSTVIAQTSTTSITGPDGSYPTDAGHNLAIGSSDVLDRGFFQGQMVDQAIYNRALSAGEIQQLFNFTAQLQGSIGTGPVFLSRTDIDYGVVPYLSSPNQSLRVVNGTNDADEGSPTNLTLLSATITGPGASHYSLQGFVPGAVIAAGAALPINVQFDGTTDNLGTYDALLTLVTDQGAAPGSPGQTFTVPLTAVLAAAVDLNGPAAGTGYVSTWINTGPVSIVDSTSASFTDAGNTNPVSMTATLSVPQAGDVLSANTSGTNITAAYAAGTLSLTGSDTVANYEKVLRTLTYTNTNGGPGSLTETVQIVANDNALNSATAISTIIIDLNAPTIDLNGPAAGGAFTTVWTPFGAVNIANPISAALDDVDSANLAWVTVALDSPRPGDVLAVNSYGSNISANFVNGVLTLSGADLVANYQALLRTVTYDNTNGGPGVPLETLQVVASDGGLVSAPVVSTITIDLTPPIIDLNGPASGSGFTSTWTGGQVNIADAAAATIVDAGTGTLQSMTLGLTQPTAGDVLTANTAGTSVTSAFVNGTLTLSGSDTLAHYQQVLRSVTYSNTASGPGVNSATVQVVAYDGTAPGNIATAIVTMPPVLNLTGGSSTPNFTTSWYNSGSVPIVNMVQATAIDPAGVTQLASLTVTLTTFHTGDLLSVPTLPGTAITSSYANGTLTLSGVDSVADYQRTLRFINYNNTAGGPGTGSVTATLVASDGTYSSSPVTSTININVASGQVLGNRLFYNNSKYDGNNGAINANDDAAIASDKLGFNGVGTATFANISSFNRGITGVMIDLQAGLGTHSLINLASGDITFRVSPTAFVASTYNQLSTWTTAPTPAAISVRLGAGTGGSDRIEITWPTGAIKNTWLEVDVHSGGNSGLSSDDNFFFGSVIGDSGVGDTASLAKTDGNDYIATFSNIAGVTTPVWNALDYTKDGKVDGSDANVSISNISSLHYIANLVTPQTPLINLSGVATTSTSTWTHAGPVAVAANATLTGGPSLSWLTVSLSSPEAGDILAANTTGTSITLTFVNGGLTLTGSDTLAHYQQVLRSVTYDNTSPTGPGVNSEIVQVIANDGTFSSPLSMAIVTMPPVLSLTGASSTPNYTTSWYNSGSVPIVNMVQASLVDPAGVTQLASVTVTLTTFHTGDLLSVPTLAGTAITSSYANGTLTLSGVDSVADYQRTLRFINYNNTTGGPGTGSVTATLVASDGTYSSSPVTSTININVASGQVLGNRLFYNNSKYDGNNGAINANDDAAIASDKLGFNGVGTATFANISSFSRGITGVMVDLQAGLGTHNLINLTSGDITFKVSPTAFVASTYNQLSTWTTAPTPAAISVRLGAGTGGSDRIEITWPNGAIQDTWLAVDVHAGGNTGLSSDDIFYFGSVIGDSGVGDSATLAKTDGNDNTAAINNVVGLTTPVWNALDFSKDGKVDGSDANLPISSLFALHYLANPTGSLGSPAASPAAVMSSATPITTAVSTTDHVVAASLPSSLSLGAPLLMPNWILGGPLHSTVVSAPDGPSPTHAASSPQFLQAIDQIARKFDATDESLDSLLAELGLR